MKYKTNSQGFIGADGNREWAEFDNLMSARRHCIREITKKRRWAGGLQNYWYNVSFGGRYEMVQAVNDGKANYICVVRGFDKNDPYLQILNPKGEPVSPKMSINTFEKGWKNGLKWYYAYTQ